MKKHLGKFISFNIKGINYRGTVAAVTIQTVVINTVEGQKSFHVVKQVFDYKNIKDGEFYLFPVNKQSTGEKDFLLTLNRFGNHPANA